MRKYAYNPQIGDKVTTVSLNRGTVTAINGEVLTIEHSQNGFEGVYYASVGAVLRCKRDEGFDFVYEHRSNRDRAHPYHTSFGAMIFDRYFKNKRAYGETNNKAA